MPDSLYLINAVSYTVYYNIDPIIFQTGKLNTSDAAPFSRPGLLSAFPGIILSVSK